MIYVKRADSEPPKWLGALQTATSWVINILVCLVFVALILS